MRTFKLSHKRQRADEEAARGLIGIPHRVVGLLLGRVLSGTGFAGCLFHSVVVGLAALVGADVDDSERQ